MQLTKLTRWYKYKRNQNNKAMPVMKPLILVLNGPNLNMLGTREPTQYGRETLADLAQGCADSAHTLGLDIEFRQTNHEGELIDWIHAARGRCAGILINPAPGPHLGGHPRRPGCQ